MKCFLEIIQFLDKVIPQYHEVGDETQILEEAARYKNLDKLGNLEILCISDEQWNRKCGTESCQTLTEAALINGLNADFFWWYDGRPTEDG